MGVALKAFVATIETLDAFRYELEAKFNAIPASPSERLKVGEPPRRLAEEKVMIGVC